MKLLVTGGNGFIGSNFIEHVLESRHAEVVVNIDKMTSVASTWIDEKYKDSSSYDKLETDICTLKVTQIPSIDFDACIHFAAESHVDRSVEDANPFITTNISGTLNIAKICDTLKIPMIHISTDEVYGHLEDINENPFDVDDALEPRNPYAASKAAAELMLIAYANVSDTFEYYIIRPSNNYGPRQDETKFLPKLIRCLYTGESFPMYGKGDFWREWTWVTDTADGIVQVLDAIPVENGTKFNITSGITLTNFDMAMYVAERMRRYKQDTTANISFIKDPRGRAHDKIYAIKNSINKGFIDLEYGIEILLDQFFNQDNVAG